MTRFIVATAVAVVLGLGYSGKADAQNVYGRSVPNGSGLMTGSSFFVPGVFNNNFYSQPFPSIYSQPSPSFYSQPFPSLYSQPFPVVRNAFNPTFAQPFGVNGTGFNNNFFQSNFSQPRFSGNSYGGFNRNSFYMGRTRRR